MPQDLILNSTTDNNEDPVLLVKTGSDRRVQMETKAKEGQKKEGDYINKSWRGDTGVKRS